MTFKIPESVAARRVPSVPVDPEDGRGEVTWRGTTAFYTDAEKASLRGLPADELWVAHQLKAELDATLIENDTK